MGVPLTTVAGKLEVPVAAAQRLERLRFCWQLFWRLLLELEHFPEQKTKLTEECNQVMAFPLESEYGGHRNR